MGGKPSSDSFKVHLVTVSGQSLGLHNGAVSRNYLGTSFLEQCCPIELSVMMEMFCICVVS